MDEKDVRVIRNLYWDQEATVKYGTERAQISPPF